MRILWSVVLLLVLVPSFAGTERLALYQPDARFDAVPVALDATQPNRRKLGILTYLGGWQLRSWDAAFGGFSSMHVAGDAFVLLSDGGNFLRFRMTPRGPAGFSTGALPAGPGRGWDKHDRDSESLAVDPATGRLWVGFEQYNAIYRYAPGFARIEKRVRPSAMAKWTEDFGPEALVRLRSGGFLVIAERDPKDHHRGPSPALFFAGDPTGNPRPAFAFRYQPQRGFHPTDAVELPDGRIAVLERHFSLRHGFAANLSIVARAAIRPNALVRGREVASFAGTIVHDNFEALAVTQEQGATILWIASDDNQQWWERSLLLKFRLDE